MKKECEHTRKMLRRYRSGHVFAPDRKRIERHLKACPVCSSEFQTLKRTAETHKLIKDITPPEGVAQRVKAHVSTVGKLKKLLYRPLWIAVIAGLIWAAYYALPLLLHDRDLENLGTPAVTSSPSTTVSAAAPVVEPKQPERSAAQAPPATQSVKPLVVTITVENERAAMQRINSVMKGHELLRTMQLTDKAKEISGSLTAKELLTFFGRIESAGRITYSRPHLESFSAAQPLPFVLKLKAAPPQPRQAVKPLETLTPQAAEKPAAAPAPQAAPAQ